MLPQHKDLDRGWAWAALAASFVALSAIGGSNYSSGLIHTTLLDRFRENQGTTSWAGALHSALFNLAAPLSAVVVDRYSVRTAILCGGLLMSIGYISSAFATSLAVTIFTCGIISGLGGAVSWTASMISTGFYFQKYRNIAMGISVSGASVGLFGVPPAVQGGREAYGTAGLFIVLSCIAMQLIVCAVIIRPSSLELHTKRKEKEASKTKNRTGKFKLTLIRQFKVLTFQPIMCLSISMFMHCAGHYVVFQYLPNYCSHEGTRLMQISLVLSACGVASIFGRLLTGLVASWRNMNEIYVYCLSMFLTGLSTVLFPLFASTLSGQVIFSSLFGLFFGGVFVTITPINISIVGVSNMAIALGIQLCFGGVGAAMAPVLAGLLLDKGWSYGNVFVLAGVTCVVGSCIGLLTNVFMKCGTCRVQFSQSVEVHEMIEGETETLAPQKEHLSVP